MQIHFCINGRLDYCFVNYSYSTKKNCFSLEERIEKFASPSSLPWKAVRVRRSEILNWCQSTVATGGFSLSRINDARRRFPDRSIARRCKRRVSLARNACCRRHDVVLSDNPEILMTRGARGLSRFSLSSRRIEKRTSASGTTTATAKCERPGGVTDFMIRCIIVLYERGISRHASSREFRAFRENAENNAFAGFSIRREFNAFGLWTQVSLWRNKIIHWQSEWQSESCWN